jgi:hypothetical protein
MVRHDNPDNALDPVNYAEIQCTSEGGLLTTWFGLVPEPGGSNDNAWLEANYAGAYGPSMDAFEQFFSLSSAVSAAKQALAEKKPCRDLFSPDFDPSSVLDHLMNGDATYGKFSWDAMGAAGNVAEVRVTQPNQVAAVGWTVNVTINSSGGGGWFDHTGDIQRYGNYGFNSINAATIIHELGHVFEFLFGANTTRILNDAHGGSLANSDLVMSECFGWQKE